MRTLLLSTLAIMMALVLPCEGFAGKVQLTKDTQLKVKFSPSEKINSGKLEEGAEVAITLVEDFEIGGITIIEAGAKGTAKVTEAVKASRPGKPGKITVSFVDLAPKGDFKAKGDKKIMLSGEVTDEGGGRKIISWLFILGLLIKGGQGEIDTAADYTATVGETIALESR